jgi:hypothetical protein
MEKNTLTRLSILSLALICLISGCNNQSVESDTGNDSTMVIGTEVHKTEEGRETQFKFAVINKNDAGRYKKLVTEADSLLNIVFNTHEFKMAVLSHKFDWKDLGNGRTDSLTSQEVFDSLFTKKNLAEVNLYFKKKRLTNVTARVFGTVGKTIVGSNSTVTYTDWIDLSNDNYMCTLLSYTSHIAHEYCHQRGFYDKDYNQALYRNVVPYAIGDIVCRLLNLRYKAICKCNE